MAEALQALPRLFSICGVAQASAGVAACEDAHGIAAIAAERARRRILVTAETVQEHARRLLLDWPKLFLDAPPKLDELAAIHRCLTVVVRALGGRIWQGEAGTTPPVLDLSVAGEQLQQLDAALAHAFFGMAGADWLQIRDGEALRQWYRRTMTVAARTLRAVEDGFLATLGRSSIGTLPPIAAGAFSAILDADATDRFSVRPEWNRNACETGSLARQGGHRLIVDLQRWHGNGLMTRLTARLTELASLPRRMRRYLRVLQGASSALPFRSRGGVPEAQSGIGIVETARGRLVHRVRLCNGMVERYRIVAPTEWNFHPDGPLVRGILGLPVSSVQDLQRYVAMLVVALDPCVAHEVIVEPARAEEL